MQLKPLWHSLLFVGLLLFSATSYAQLPREWQQFPPGPHNDITDVGGLRVNHLTEKVPPLRATGVTVILPDMDVLSDGEGNLATHGLWAGGATLNGNGEMTGLTFVNTFGVASGPVVLTATQHLGQAYTAVRQWMAASFPQPWPVGLPLVGECWDGALNHPKQPPIRVSAILQFLTETAQPPFGKTPNQPLPQGRIGAGTGMRSFGLFAGIGSASRRVTIGEQTYTVGVLVNMNHSRQRHLLPSFQQALTKEIGNLTHAHQRLVDAQQAAQLEQHPPPTRQGSIIVIIATDAPLLPHQLQQMARHATVGLATLGSRLSTTSGDFALAISTAQAVPLVSTVPKPITTTALPNDGLNPLFEATIEGVVAAQFNALVAANSPVTPQ